MKAEKLNPRNGRPYSDRPTPSWDTFGALCLVIAAVLTALSCEHAPAKAGPQLAPLTDVQVEWIRECAKRLDRINIGGGRGPHLVVAECRARARLLW